MASRKSSHKMKSAITGEREKRLLRVHRRSLDQREMRQEAINKRRQIDISPLIESQEASKNPSATATPVNQSAAASRLERLKKWKEERELKRKLEAMEKAKIKPEFKVVHMYHKDVHLYQKMTNVKETVKPAAVKPAPAVASKAAKPRAVAAAPPSTKACTAKNNARTNAANSSNKGTVTNGTAKSTSSKRTAEAVYMAKKPDVPPVTRTTRSRDPASVKTLSPVLQKKAKRSPSKRTAGSNFMAPTAASRTRAVSKTRKATAPPAPMAQKKRGGQAKAVVMKDAGKESTARGKASPPTQPSFAPSGFVFEAPGNVSSFVFKPLSPNSAAGFLLPQSTADSTTLSVFTNRVGRTSTPKSDVKRHSSSEEDTSDGTTVSDEVKKARPSSGRARLRRSCAKAADRSPIIAGKHQTSKRIGSGPATDFGINAVGMDSNSKRLTQNSSADSVTSAEEKEVLSSEKSPLCNSLRTNCNSVSRTLDAGSISEQENQSVTVTAEVAEEATSLSRSQAGNGKRKSKRVTIQEDLSTDPRESKENAHTTKQRRKSRRSAITCKSVVEAESEGMQEFVAEASASAQSSSGKVTEEQVTPSRSHRNRRSVMSRSKEIEPEEKTNEKDQEKKSGRKSRHSKLTSADSSDEPDAGDCKEVDENIKKADSHNSRKSRSRHSVAKQPEDSTESKDVDSSESKLHSRTKTETLPYNVHTDMEVSEPSTPESSRQYLRGMCAKDDMFLTPGLPVSSQKRSTAKRRRTATMIALSSAKSPEEAVKIIATSPMIEMNRRTPKTRISPGVQNQSAKLVFEDNDFVLAPLQLSSEFDAVSHDAVNTNGGMVPGDGATSRNVQTASSSEKEGSCGSDSGEEKRDVNVFRERLSAESKKLTELSDRWTSVSEGTEDLPEEVEGQVRTTVCQAQLLMDRKGKFHQFAGLVDSCEAGDPTTTCQDLQGFWDMIFIQAEDIYTKFDQLERLQQNNWQPHLPAAQPAKKSKKLTTGGNKKQKPQVRSKFAAFKAQMMKQRKAQEVNADAGNMPEEKVFDAGFFKVNSPVRTPSYHCEVGTPKSKSTSDSKDPSQTPVSSMTTEKTVPEVSTTTPKVSLSEADNKENVAQVLLRRSGRKSYLPTVPSPLLKDGALSVSSPSLSLPKEANSAAKNSDKGGGEKMEKSAVHTPVRPRRSLAARRSSHGRRSVSFVEKLQEENGDVEPQEEGVDMMAYLQPSTSQSTSPFKECAMEDSPFSVEDVLRHSKSHTPLSVSPALQESSGGLRKNCLKTLPSNERRRSRRSHVSFATSTSTTEGSFALPSTPYNRNTLVPGKRVTRHSVVNTNAGEQSVLSELQELCATPPLRRSARPSLLYTPPKVDNSKPKAPSKDVPVAMLISFSPSDQ